MSKLLDLLQRIGDGSPAPLGFGATRAETLPGMALVGLVSADHQAGLAAAAQAGLNAAILSGLSGADAIKALSESGSAIPWGLQAAALAADEAQASRDAGADLLAFSLDSAASAITGEDDLARMVSLAPDLSDRELRAVAALPVDCFTIDMTAVSGPWTLQDLVTVGSISRRTDKHVLVQVSAVPADPDLEALRDMGVAGLIIDLAVISSEALAGLKAALLEMPRPRRRRDRIRATVPGPSPSAPRPPARQDDPDDDDYDDD